MAWWDLLAPPKYELSRGAARKALGLTAEQFDDECRSGRINADEHGRFRIDRLDEYCWRHMADEEQRKAARHRLVCEYHRVNNWPPPQPLLIRDVHGRTVVE